MSGRLALALALLLFPAAARAVQETAIRPAVPEASDRAVIERARVLKRPKCLDGQALAIVAVRVLVAANGEVVSARAVAGPEELRKPATDAAKAWEFTSSGDPDDLTGYVVFRFAPGHEYADILGVRDQELAQTPNGAPAAAQPPRTSAPAVAPSATTGAAQPKRKETGKAAEPAQQPAAPKPAPAQEGEPRRVTTSELIAKAERKASPSYPSAAANARVEGTVVVEVLVDEHGKVAEARAVSGHVLLREAAVSAARDWAFKPTVVAGKPVKIQSTLIFNFRR